ncbi:MAG: GFA family protein [Pseudomonadota bacterium]
MAAKIHGSCLCTTVRWTYSGPPAPMGHCHCSICRKCHGTAFATYMGGDGTHFAFTAGESAVRRYESSPGFMRAFCGGCGSVVPGIASDGHVFMPAGCFDGDPGARPKAHIFVAHRSDWYAIEDELRQFDAFARAAGPDLLSVDDEMRVKDAAGGTCACAGVAFRIDGSLVSAQFCHCTRCQKARSAAHATNAFGPSEAVVFLRGEDLIEHYKVPDARFFTQAFCRVCGSPAPRIDPGRGIAVIPFGAFDVAPEIRPQRHIFAANKAVWFDIPGALPQFDGDAPAA